MDRRGPHNPATDSARPPPKPARHDGPTHIGRFTILDRIGSGAMGELFLGWDSQLDRKLAIKLVHARSSSAAAEERLRQEAKALAQLSHPNVVQVFEVGSHAGRVYVAMEFVEGKSLRDWLATLQLDGPRRIAAIVEHFVAAGRGLEAVHGTGLIHRDFKPSNVVVGDDGRVRIIDFGLASELDDVPDEGDDPTPPQTCATELAEKERARWDATLTDTGVLLGTPRYMAPEQWRGRPGDMRSDQFAWCVALFEALYGVHPFEHTGVEGLAKRASSTLRRLTEKAGLADAMNRSEIELPPRWAEAPARVREALVRGLSLDPKARFPSMAELLDHIAPPAPSARRTLAAVIGGCLLAIAAAIVVSLLLPDRDGTSSTSAIAHARIEALAARDLVRVQQRVAELDAQAQLAEADETFAAYAEMPEYARTAALGRGWLAHAERLAARGDTEGELDAYGAAYISASPDTQREALFGLARVFARTRQWPALRATLDTLGSLAAPADQARAAERCGMRVVEMVARHELTGAAKMVGDTSTPDCAIHPAITAAIVELARVTPTEHDLDGHQLRVAPTPGLDLDHDGVGELLVHRPGEAKITVLGSASTSLGSVASIDLPEVPGGLVILPHPDEPMVSMRTGTRISLHRVGLVDSAPTLTPLFELDQQHPWPSRWVSGDLDGDGRLEAYATVTPRRRLLVAYPGESDWLSADPHPPTSATNSVPYELVLDDFDGDARPELAVAVGEWNAYDLRIFGAAQRESDDPTAPPMLELLGRRKLGTAQSIAAIPAASGPGKWLVVGVSALYPSQRVFENPPATGTPGVYVFAWDGKRLEQITYVDVTPPDLMFTGDFNGDGLADLALASHLSGVFQTTLLIQTAPGSFEPLAIDRLWPIGVFDRDRDGDDELLVLDTSGQTGPRLSRPRGPLYVLGSGDGRLPGVVDTKLTPNQPLAPPTEDDAVRASVARAEDLATIGLPLRAAAELRKLARVAEPELAASLWVRAAELLEARGHRLAAADLYAQASADPQLLGERVGPTRRKAMQLYEQIHRFRAATDMAAAAVELDPSLAAEHARLQALASDELQLVFDFDEPLDSGWTIDPLAVRRRGGRLEFDLGGAEQDVVARRELDYRGGRLALDVELDIELIEWGSEINIALRPIGDKQLPELPVGAATRGGGGLYKLEFACVGLQISEPGAVGYPMSQPRAELPEDRRRYRLRTELVPPQSDADPGNVWCSAEGNGVQIEGAVPNVGLLPGRYELVIYGARNDRWGRATGSIDRIVITGAHDVEPRPSSPAEQLARELAEGRMEAVLEGLDAAAAMPTRERALLEFLALDELGRPDEREAALIAALGPCGRDEASRMLVGTLLRHRPEHLAADLRRLCGMDRYYSLFMEVWANAIYQHPDAIAVGRVLTTQTTELERWQPRNAADRHAVLALLCARARSRLSLGTPGPNRADLQRAVDLGDKWLAAGEFTGRTKLATQLGRCRVDLAAELLDRGEANRAVEALRETLRRSPTPEIVADMLAIDPRFASLRERPDWRELIEPARAGVDENAAHR